jgi:CDGSH iron-sulfur domain-containing protein 3
VSNLGHAAHQRGRAIRACQQPSVKTEGRGYNIQGFQRLDIRPRRVHFPPEAANEKPLKKETSMSKGQIAAKAPISVQVEKGKAYFWCSCGKSAKQPFCDGSHKGSDFSPMKWEADESKTAWFCACKQTAKSPLCDGSHKAL